MPILVRPVREQLEHDRIIRLLEAQWRQKYKVDANPGDERNAAIKVGTSTLYPDLVLTEEGGRKPRALVEVETGESVNHLEAMAQWAHFARAKSSLYLFVPAGSVETARRLASDHQIELAELWTYLVIGDQVRFTSALGSSSEEALIADRPVAVPVPPRRPFVSDADEPPAEAEVKPAAPRAPVKAAGKDRGREKAAPAKAAPEKAAPEKVAAQKAGLERAAHEKTGAAQPGALKNGAKASPVKVAAAVKAVSDKVPDKTSGEKAAAKVAKPAPVVAPAAKSAAVKPPARPVAQPSEGGTHKVARGAPAKAASRAVEKITKAPAPPAKRPTAVKAQAARPQGRGAASARAVPRAADRSGAAGRSSPRPAARAVAARPAGTRSTTKRAPARAASAKRTVGKAARSQKRR